MVKAYDPCAECDDAADTPADGPAGTGFCEPGPGNAAVVPAGPTAAQVSAIDVSRRQLHVQGVRAYQVALVWRRRDSMQRWQEVRRIQLMPVKVESVANVDWVSGASGMHADGTILLTEVSLAQVSDADLQGRLDGKDPPEDVEFYVEVCRYPRCADDVPAAQRYTPSSLPEYDVEGLQWKMYVTDAHNPVNKTTSVGIATPKLRM